MVTACTERWSETDNQITSSLGHGQIMASLLVRAHRETQEKTLSVVGVERSISETARRTSKGRKSGAWCVCDAPKVRTAGRALIWVVFWCKGAERGAWRGLTGRADALAVVVLWRKEDRADEPIFGGVWSKTQNSSPRRLAIGCFQRNQYVTLSSSVLFQTIALQQTVLHLPVRLYCAQLLENN